MRIDLPMCNFKNCHWCHDSNCYKKTRDYCEYHWQNTEIERLRDLVEELQQYNEAWVEDNGKLRKEMKALKTDTVQKMQEKIRAKSEYGTINISPWQLDQIAKEVLEENK